MKTSVKTIIAIVSLCLCAALFAACGSAPANNAPADNTPAAGSSAAAPAAPKGSAAAAPEVSSAGAQASGAYAPEVPANPVIGKAAEGEMIKKVSLTNLTGQDITGFAVKYSGEKAFGKNMLPKGETFKLDEVRDLYYDIAPAMAANTNGEEGTAGSSGGAIVYSAQLTLADGTQFVLYDLPFNEFEQGRLILQNNVLFLEYVSPYTNEDVVTRTQEAKAQKAAEEEAAAAAAKAAEEEASRAAEEQAAAWAAQQQAAQQQQYYEQPQQYYEQPQQNTDAGCIGNSGLVY